MMVSLRKNLIAFLLACLCFVMGCDGYFGTTCENLQNLPEGVISSGSFQYRSSGLDMPTWHPWGNLDIKSATVDGDLLKIRSVDEQGREVIETWRLKNKRFDSESACAQ